MLFPGSPPPVSSSRAQPRLAFFPGKLVGERVVLRQPVFRAEPGQRTAVPGAAPLDYVARVQVFSAQQRALVAVTGTAVILVEDRQFVVSGEASPPRSIWHRGFVAHDFIMGASHRQGSEDHFVRDPIPPCGVGLLLRVSQLSLTHRAEPVCESIALMSLSS